MYLELRIPGDNGLSDDDVAVVHGGKLKGVVDAARANVCMFDNYCEAFFKIVIGTGSTGLFGKVRSYLADFKKITMACCV